MNSLLARVTAGEQRPTLVETADGERTLSLLEWPQVTNQIASFCLTSAAAAQIRQRRPYTELEPLQLWWTLIDELRPEGEAGNWPPLLEISTGWELLDRPIPGGFSAEELVMLAALAEALDEMRDHLCQARNRLPVWGEAALELATFGSLTAEIRRAVDRDGHLQDSASTTLARLRRACRAQEKVVRQEVTTVMQRARSRGWTTESEVTLRGDRFCLPLRTGASRQIEGIVHARSASGGTLFVEPASVVHLHNELSELRLEVADEERRILLELNRRVEEAAPALDEACRFLILVDQVRAGILWSKHYHCSRPRLNLHSRLRLCACRHPLLTQFGPSSIGVAPGNVSAESGQRDDRGQVVPLDLEMPADKQVVVLSGPNAGGKSVALKTLGVCVLLCQSGWDVPAREDTELPLVKSLFVDLGDEQSIEKSLSSFSAHLGHLVRFLEQSDGHSLVLCDEIGSGTDPQEGTALAFAVLVELARQGALVLASTHFGLLKAAVHDHPQMINAAMDFDEVSLRPLFTLRMGVPGTSHAFAIAARLGMPENLLAQAREMVGEERFQIERLLGELGRRARDLASAEKELRQQLATYQGEQSALSEKLAKFESQRQKLLAETRTRGEELLREGRQAIERAVREIRSSDGGDHVIRTARDRLTSLGERLPAPAPPPPQPTLEPGSRIHIPHLGLSGQVVEIRGDKIVAEAQGMRLTLNRQALVASDVEPAGEGSTVAPETDARTRNGMVTEAPIAEASWRWHDLPPEVQHEIDLRGQRAEEAWRQLDHLIDRAIPAGLREILVIHGVGSGRLRAYLHEQLAGDRRLASFQAAAARRGGHGATVVRLADA